MAAKPLSLALYLLYLTSYLLSPSVASFVSTGFEPLYSKDVSISPFLNDKVASLLNSLHFSNERTIQNNATKAHAPHRTMSLELSARWLKSNMQPRAMIVNTLTRVYLKLIYLANRLEPSIAGTTTSNNKLTTSKMIAAVIGVNIFI